MTPNNQESVQKVRTLLNVILVLLVIQFVINIGSQKVLVPYILGFCLAFAIIFQVFKAIKNGKNWARISYLILAILFLPINLLTALANLSGNLTAGLISVALTVVTVLVIINLLNKDTKRYYLTNKNKAKEL